MADNVVANPGTGGATFATDEITGVHYPRQKVGWGPDGTFNDADAASGKALPAQGDAAHDAIDYGNPVKVGAKAADPASLPTAVAAGDRVNIITDLQGKLLVIADTELPAAAALADGASNPTTPLVGAPMLVYNGATWDRVRTPVKFVDMSAVAIGSIATVWTPTGGKKFRLMGGMISLSAAASVLFEDNAGGTTICRTPKLLADTPYNFDLGNGILSGAADRVLKATSSAAANITGTLYGTEE